MHFDEINKLSSSFWLIFKEALSENVVTMANKERPIFHIVVSKHQLSQLNISICRKIHKVSTKNLLSFWSYSPKVTEEVTGLNCSCKIAGNDKI